MTMPTDCSMIADFVSKLQLHLWKLGPVYLMTRSLSYLPEYLQYEVTMYIIFIDEFIKNKGNFNLSTEIFSLILSTL